jgi:UDP-glucose 4-epimerase
MSITGGAGYIGSHMVHELPDAGERVVVLDNLSTGFDWALPKDVPLIIGNTGDHNLAGQIIRDHKVASIIQFAASAIVPDSVKDPLGYYKNNTVNSRALIETAIKHGVPQFIFSSTCAVYGDPAQVPVTEDTLPAATRSPGSRTSCPSGGRGCRGLQSDTLMPSRGLILRNSERFKARGQRRGGRFVLCHKK